MFDLSSLAFGPFTTNYHRRLVTEALKDKLYQFIIEDIVPQVDHAIIEVDGTFSPRVTNDEDCGPRCPLRNCFYLELYFFGNEQTQHSDISLQLWYRPNSSRLVASKGSSLYVWTPSRRAECESQRAAIDAMTDAAFAGIVETPFCPICFAEIRIARMPDEYFSAACPNDCFLRGFQISHRGRRFNERFKMFDAKHDT